MSESRVQYLFQRWFNGAETPAENQELQQLLEDSRHDAALQTALEEAWTGFTPDARMEEEDAARIFQQITAPKTTVRPMRRWWAVAAAAAVLGMAVVGYNRLKTNETSSPQTISTIADIAPGANKATLTLADGSVVTLDSAGNQVIRQGSARISQHGGQLRYEDDGGQPVWNKLSTPRAGQFRLTLPDGTRVWLNAASSIRYPTAFAGQERKVEITGEVYFEVMPDALKPFRVEAAGRSRVEVLGTSFNISAYDDETFIKTTLLEGKVKVGAKDSPAQELRPGQQARQAASGSITVSSDIDPAEVLAWKEGWFLFNQASLPEVMRQLSRWYDVEVKYEGAVPDKTFEGKIRRDLTLAQVLRILERSGVHTKIEGKQLTLLP
ncbi:FecR family protein [Chitinophaga sp. GCM10012297]|uniref:FecR domain-containing protein n=1 Tax=Chitinophaga chungangae TaxID=2821488 RepID=A0ABS3YI67_9BACT|nr:FecR family protein [Chitinophaga chungangae]MBO9154392.1 FecR domain-containing protein [Chitinophaga chungangae]